MPRIRTIKPEFFNSFDVASLSPLSRLFYAYLWTESDRDGFLEWKPKNFRMRFFPTDQYDIEDLESELVEQELIIVHADIMICEIPGFTKHQVINNRESQSELAPRVKDACTRVKAEGRKERKGKEGRVPRNGEIEFSVFWETCPKKVDRKKAESAWGRLTVENQRLALADYSSRYNGAEKRFIPNPTTYLHGERWLDEYTREPKELPYGYGGD